MDKVKALESELQLIENEELRNFVRQFLDEKVPNTFWYAPASSSGKYHPNFATQKHGTLLHTKYVCAWAKELMCLEQTPYYVAVNADAIYAACILHDSFKYGYADDSEHTVDAHPQIASVEWTDFCIKQGYSHMCYAKFIAKIIECHMGQWGFSFPDTEDQQLTECCEFVHLCDYIASRKLIDGLKEEE